MSEDRKRYVIVGSIRIDITDCYWCGALDDAICAACHEKAEAARKAIIDD